MAFEISFRS